MYQKLQIQLDDALKQIVHYEITKVSAIHLESKRQSRKVAEGGYQSGVPSGLVMLDKFTSGWQKPDLIILAGRPGMGKTAIAVSMIMNPAIKNSIPVAFFSLEMSKEQLVARMQSQLSEVNVSRIVKKQLTETEIDVVVRCANQLETAPIYIDDTPSITLLELKSKARKLVKEQKIQLIVIDYLQLMRSGLNISNREQEIAEISRGLKSLAKELSIPIIALSQLSRAVESRGDKKPMLQDLRESGQIEQDADMVLFCYRPEYYSNDSYDLDGINFDSHGLFVLIVSKHRNGDLGEIPLKFIHEQTKVTNHSFNNLDNSQNSSTFVQPSILSETISFKGRENTDFDNE